MDLVAKAAWLLLLTLKGQAVPPRLALRGFSLAATFDMGLEPFAPFPGQQEDGTFMLILENVIHGEIAIHREPLQRKLEVWTSVWTKEFVGPVVLQNHVTFKHKGMHLNDLKNLQWQLQTAEEEKITRTRGEREKYTTLQENKRITQESLAQKREESLVQLEAERKKGRRDTRVESKAEEATQILQKLEKEATQILQKLEKERHWQEKIKRIQDLQDQEQEQRILWAKEWAARQKEYKEDEVRLEKLMLNRRRGQEMVAMRKKRDEQSMHQRQRLYAANLVTIRHHQEQRKREQKEERGVQSYSTSHFYMLLGSLSFSFCMLLGLVCSEGQSCSVCQTKEVGRFSCGRRHLRHLQLVSVCLFSLAIMWMLLGGSLSHQEAAVHSMQGGALAGEAAAVGDGPKVSALVSGPVSHRSLLSNVTIGQAAEGFNRTGFGESGVEGTSRLLLADIKEKSRVYIALDPLLYCVTFTQHSHAAKPLLFVTVAPRRKDSVCQALGPDNTASWLPKLKLWAYEAAGNITSTPAPPAPPALAVNALERGTCDKFGWREIPFAMSAEEREQSLESGGNGSRQVVGKKVYVARFSASYRTDECEDLRLKALHQQLKVLNVDFAVHLLLDLTQLVLAWRVKVALELKEPVTESLFDKHPAQAAAIRAKLEEYMKGFRERFLGLQVTGYTAADVVCAYPDVNWPIPDTPLETFTSEKKWLMFNRHSSDFAPANFNWYNSYALIQNQQKWLLEKKNHWYLQVFQANIDEATSFEQVYYIMNQLNKLKLQIGFIPMVNYLIHEPSIVLFFRKSSAQLAAVFESDAYFLGDMQQQWADVEQRAKRAAARGKTFYSAAVDNSWTSYRWMYNSAFLDKFAATGLIHKWEHVEYFSKGFAAQLDHALQQGLAAHGEDFATSVCHGLDSCELEGLRYLKTPPLEERDALKNCLAEMLETKNPSPLSCRSKLIFNQFYHKIFVGDQKSDLCKIAFSNSSSLGSIWT